LEELARELNADPKRAPWEDHFYQLANRLAHLNFLRKQGVSAWLVLANFLGDSELKGPRTREAWDAAYEIVYNVMGLRRDHRLSRFVIHVFPDVSVLAG